MLLPAVLLAAVSLFSAPVVQPSAGALIGHISIPRLAETEPVRQGVSAAVLAHGPGHYPGTAMPGGAGTIAIAGHRVTHTHPFLHINLLRRGDLVRLTTPTGIYRYRVFRMAIVTPNQTWVLRSHGSQQLLVLTACHPPRTALRRIVVFARRVS